MLRNQLIEQALSHQTMERRVSRRSLIRNSALLGSAAMTGGLLAGCGDLSQRLEERRAEREAAAEDDETRSSPQLEVTNINGVELAVWDSDGDGDPVVFIHGAHGEEVMPILSQPALTEQFRLIHYQRRGWGKSPQAEEPTTMEERAADCRAVMEHVGIDLAHIEGLSAGGTIALQFAVDYPDAVQSLALLEPALPSILNESPQFMGVMGELIPYFEAGDYMAVAEGFAQEVIGEEYLESFLRNMPDGVQERWAEEMPTLFVYDSPGQEGWFFTEEMAEQITQPVLNMTAEDTEPYWSEVHEQIAELLPQSENLALPNAPHVMIGANPEGTAQQLAAFFARHPIEG